MPVFQLVDTRNINLEISCSESECLAGRIDGGQGLMRVTSHERLWD